MGFLYTMNAANITVANAAVTLLNIHTAATGRGSEVIIHRMWVSQQANVTSAMVRINWGWKVTAFPTLVALSTAVVQGSKSNAPAAILVGATDGSTGKLGMNASAEGAGALSVIGSDAFNALNGWLWIPTPDERIVIGPDISFSLQFPAAPGTLTGWNAGITFEEA